MVDHGDENSDVSWVDDGGAAQVTGLHPEVAC